MDEPNNNPLQSCLAQDSFNAVFIKTEDDSDAEKVYSGGAVLPSELAYDVAENDCDLQEMDLNIPVSSSELEYDGNIMIKEESVDTDEKQWTNVKVFVGASDSQNNMKSEIEHPDIELDENTVSSDSLIKDDRVLPPTVYRENTQVCNTNSNAFFCVSCSQRINPEQRTRGPFLCFDCQRRTSGNKTEILPTIDLTNRFSCTLCSRSFTHKGNLRRHVQLHNENKTRYSCNECGLSFSRNEDLKKHTEIIHFKIKHEKLCPCSICGKAFSRKDRLKKHMLLHSRCEPFSCPDCHLSFPRSNALKKHRIIHTNETLFTCPICDRVFADDYGLKKHKMVHNIGKPFSCSICSHSFMLEKDLKRHMMIHTNEKPFVCAVCNRTFIRKSHVKNHLKVHYKEKLSCSKCHQSFVRRKELNSHVCNRKENELIEALTTLYESLPENGG